MFNAIFLFLGIAIVLWRWKYIKRFPTGLRSGTLSKKESGNYLAAILEEVASLHVQDQKSRSGPETNWNFLANCGKAISLTPSRFVPPPTFVDKVKGSLETLARDPIIWWPLRPRRVACPEGYFRLSWKCVCLSWGEQDSSR
jgi:hypothetical protein